MQISWVVLQMWNLPPPPHQMEDINYLMTLSTELQASWSQRVDKVNPVTPPC